jgi:hypothetical protein
MSTAAEIRRFLSGVMHERFPDLVAEEEEGP